MYNAWINGLGGTLIEVYSDKDGVLEKLGEKHLETLPIPSLGSADFNEVVNSLGLHITDSFSTSKLPAIIKSDLKKASVTSLLGLPPATKVTSYTFTIDTENGVISEACNSGNNFSPATVRLIQNTGSGRIITLDDIRIEENGSEKKIPSRVYVVTN